MGKYLKRHDDSMPYQNWSPFPPQAIVKVYNCHGEWRIAVAKELWWGWSRSDEEGVIVKARRLDRVKN
jgi:hypothetical protein